MMMCKNKIKWFRNDILYKSNDANAWFIKRYILLTNFNRVSRVNSHPFFVYIALCELHPFSWQIQISYRLISTRCIQSNSKKQKQIDAPGRAMSTTRRTRTTHSKAKHHKSNTRINAANTQLPVSMINRMTAHDQMSAGAPR